MQAALAHSIGSEVLLRRARPADVDALAELEARVFRGDRISRRGFRRFVRSPRAALIVAEEDGALAGYALVLFRTGSGIARLYSIAVAPQFAKRGVGSALLAAGEDAAIGTAKCAARFEYSLPGPAGSEERLARLRGPDRCDRLR